MEAKLLMKMARRIGVSLVANQFFSTRTSTARDRLLKAGFVCLLVFGLRVSSSSLPFLGESIKLIGSGFAEWVLLGVLIFLALEFAVGAVGDLASLIVRIEMDARANESHQNKMSSDDRAAAVRESMNSDWISRRGKVALIVMISKTATDLFVPFVLSGVDVILFVWLK